MWGVVILILRGMKVFNNKIKRPPRRCRISTLGQRAKMWWGISGKVPPFQQEACTFQTNRRRAVTPHGETCVTICQLM